MRYLLRVSLSDLIEEEDDDDEDFDVFFDFDALAGLDGVLRFVMIAIVVCVACACHEFEVV